MKAYELKITKIKHTESFDSKKITTSKDAVDFARQFYSDDVGIYESFFIILLNRANNVIGWAKISQGGVVGTIVDVKIIVKYVIDSLASGVILVHNHPSGKLSASNKDKKITERLKDIVRLFDSSILDHIILTEDNYFSFADNGIL